MRVSKFWRDQGKKVNALFLFTKVHFIKLLCVIDSLREKVSLNLENQNTKELTMFQTESQNYDHP